MGDFACMHWISDPALPLLPKFLSSRPHGGRWGCRVIGTTPSTSHNRRDAQGPRVSCLVETKPELGRSQVEEALPRGLGDQPVSSKQAWGLSVGRGFGPERAGGPLSPLPIRVEPWV